MSATTLRHVVEHALGRHLDGFAGWFPAGFDWQQLCSDTPAMLRRLLEDEPPERDPDDPDAGLDDGADEDDALGLPPEVDLVEASEGTFAAAYMGALAGIALAVEDERDPDLLVERMAQPLDEDEEPRFAEAVGEALALVESALAGRGETPDEETLAGLCVTLVEAAWPGVDVALGSVPALGEEQGLPPPARQVLGGVARVAAILAAFRWLALDDRPGPGQA